MPDIAQITYHINRLRVRVGNKVKSSTLLMCVSVQVVKHLTGIGKSSESVALETMSMNAK